MRFSTLSVLASSALAVLATPLPQSSPETYDPLNIRALSDSDRIAALTAKITPITTSANRISPARSNEGIALASWTTQCYHNGDIVYKHDVEAARNWYCSYAEGVVVERGYELVLGYEVPSLGTYNRMSDIRVGYKNISGGSWVIRRDECMAWLSEVANVCSQYTLVVDSYGWIHQGGWYATSSGEVVLDPNVK